MQNFYDHVTVHGTMSADKLSGELTDETREPLDKRIDELATAQRSVQDEVTAAKTTITDLVEKYNKAIEVINNLSERLAAIENNYDPTVLK